MIVDVFNVYPDFVTADYHKHVVNLKIHLAAVTIIR